MMTPCDHPTTERLTAIDAASEVRWCETCGSLLVRGTWLHPMHEAARVRRAGAVTGLAAADPVIKAAVETTLRARKGDVCAEQSTVPGRLGCYCYCTLARQHEGVHEAKTSDGEIVASWGAA